MSEMSKSEHYPRIREKYDLPPEVDIPGATIRLFNQGKAIEFLNSDETSQLGMLRRNVPSDEERIVMPGVRNSLSELLKNIKHYHSSPYVLTIGNEGAKKNNERQPSFRTENYRSAEITPTLVEESANFYRWMFGNRMHYVVCPDCENEGHDARFTAQKVFKLLSDKPGKDRMASLEDMDDPSNIPDCPCCSNKMELVYDPQVINDNFEEKLMGSEDSFLSLLRRGDNSVSGLAFAYITELGRQQDLEWGKYQYMRKSAQKPEYTRPRSSFLGCVDQVFPERKHDGSEIILGWNCISIAPDAKGKMMPLVGELFGQIPEDRHYLHVLGDVKRGSLAHRFFKKLKGNDGESFFETSDEILIGGNVGVVADRLNLLLNKKVCVKKDTPKVKGTRGQVLNALEGGDNPGDWDKLAEEYDESVYSITSFPEKRKRIINAINDGDEVLIAGCGSATYLQRAILEDVDVQVTATDFSEGMTNVSKKGFQHPNLKHEVCDTRQLPFKDKFNAAISTNSIIPPSRDDVIAMYKSMFESLRPGGKLIAYLPSFKLCTDMLKKYPELKEAFEPRMDYEQSRFKDTVGWQCFHTEELTTEELEKVGFDPSNIEIETVRCESEHEANELGRLYGLPPELIGEEFACLFVVAKK